MNRSFWARVISVLSSLLLGSLGWGQANVVTYHNDIARTGQNTSETILTPANVGTATFAKLFSQNVDGYIYAQPLFVSLVNIPGKGTHDVVYVVTEGDSVYAFDAHNNTGTNANPLWKVTLLPANEVTVVSATDANCDDLVPQVGITSTPVIDPVTNTMYVVTKSKTKLTTADPNNTFQRLHAIDITTGAEKFGGPVTITATVNGTGDGGATVTFDPLLQHQRTALLLQNGLVYIGWASHCDNGQYHGWVMAYSASTLAQVGVFNTSPNNSQSGIWMSGGGIAGDGTNIFFATGNGTFDVFPALGGGPDYGDSIMRLGIPGAGVFPPVNNATDYFTPWDQNSFNSGDTDVASGGLILLPTLAGAASHPNVLVQAGKQGDVYLVDRSNMGGYCNCGGPDSNIVHELVGVVNTGTWGAPAFWNNNIYFGGGSGSVHLKQFTYGLDATNTPTITGPTLGSVLMNQYGPSPSVSANGTTNGILWAVQADLTAVGAQPGQAILHASPATNINLPELYNSNMVAADNLGNGVKFTPPTIANGKVFVPLATQLAVFGIKTSTSVKAAITSPANGSTLPGSSVTFNWNTGTNALYYSLSIGTQPGGSNIFSQFEFPGTTSQLVNIPASANGGQIYVRLWSYINGAWQFNDYAYTAAGTAANAVINTPTPGSTLGTSANFSWSAGTGVTYYSLRLGTQQGGTDIYSQFQGSSTSVTVNSIPATGGTIFVRLYSYINNVWQFNDYTYTGTGAPVLAAITSPAPGNPGNVSRSSPTFTWSTGTGVTYYSFRIGTTPGGTDLFNKFEPSSLTQTVPTASWPANGSTIYVRVYSYINGTWQFNATNPYVIGP